MITQRIENNEFIFEQKASHPMIYLDNWTFNKIIGNHELSERFISILNSKNGTLLCSSINIIEIAIRDDMKQIEAISNLVSKMDFAFIELISGRVISREKNIRLAGIPIEIAKPWSADNMLEAYVLHAHDFMKEFKLSEAIIKFKEDLNKLGTFSEDYNDIYDLIKKSREDSILLNKAKKRFKSRRKLICPSKPYTEDLYKMGIDYLIIHENMNMPNNEWRACCLL